VGGTCRAHVRDKRCIQHSARNTPREGTAWGNLTPRYIGLAKFGATQLVKAFHDFTETKVSFGTLS
jgi:hypothetical protein